MHSMHKLSLALFLLMGCLIVSRSGFAQEQPGASSKLAQSIIDGDLVRIRKIMEAREDRNLGDEATVKLAINMYEQKWYRANSSERKRREAIIEQLFSHVADPKSRSRISETIIEYDPYPWPTILRLLLKYGADPNAKAYNIPLLCSYAHAGLYENVHILLDYGANIEVRDSDGRSVLTRAAGWGNSDTPPFNTDANAIKTLGILLRKGANINAIDEDGWTALMSAAAVGHGLVVKYLVQHGAKIDLRNRGGMDAFTMLAHEGRNDPGVRELLKRGAKIGPIQALLMRDKSTFLKMMERGDDLSGLGPDGDNLLLIAAEQANLPIVQRLLTRGFAINSKDATGATPLLLAIAGRRANGFIFYYPDQGHEPARRKELVEFLLDHGADVSAKLVDGRYTYVTAYGIAREAQSEVLAALFKSRGVTEMYIRVETPTDQPRP